MAITQFEGNKPKHKVSIDGVDYHLKKDATDSTASFFHQRVVWLNTGCEKINESPSVHFCWIMGVVPPTPNTLEVPMSVFYVGFHDQKINMNPQYLTQTDLDRMHVYAADAKSFASKFANSFLGHEEKEVQNRDPISSFPSVIMGDGPDDE